MVSVHPDGLDLGARRSSARQPPGEAELECRHDLGAVEGADEELVRIGIDHAEGSTVRGRVHVTGLTAGAEWIVDERATSVGRLANLVEHWELGGGTLDHQDQ